MKFQKEVDSRFPPSLKLWRTGRGNDTNRYRKKTISLILPIWLKGGDEEGDLRFFSKKNWVPDNDIPGSAPQGDSVLKQDFTALRGPTLRYGKLGPSVRWDLRCATGGQLKQIMYNAGMGEYYVYILASRRNGTLYVGMAGDLDKRVIRHKGSRGSKFVQKYNVHRLVYFEKVNSYQEACDREKQLKWWKRKWKLALIERMNPEWKDLSKENLDPR